jgi:hypothetical protein
MVINKYFYIVGFHNIEGIVKYGHLFALCCEMFHMMKNNKDLLWLTLSNNYNASFVLSNFAVSKVSQLFFFKFTLKVFFFFLILFVSTTWKFIEKKTLLQWNHSKVLWGATQAPWPPHHRAVFLDSAQGHFHKKFICVWIHIEFMRVLLGFHLLTHNFICLCKLWHKKLFPNNMKETTRGGGGGT